MVVERLPPNRAILLEAKKQSRTTKTENEAPHLEGARTWCHSHTRFPLSLRLSLASPPSSDPRPGFTHGRSRRPHHVPSLCSIASWLVFQRISSWGLAGHRSHLYGTPLKADSRIVTIASLPKAEFLAPGSAPVSRCENGSVRWVWWW